MTYGREEIFTDVPYITNENIQEVLRKAISTHRRNVARIDYLLNYEAGYQPLMRTKQYRKDIDCECVDNIANEVTEFNLGFKWGNPITLVQRGERTGEDEIKAVSILNDCYETESIKTKTQKLGRFVEIDAIGYTYVDVNMDWQEGDSYFNIEALDPRNTFVVRSNYYIDKRVMLGVTYYTDEHGQEYYTCFTKDTRFDLVGLNEIINEEWNPLKRVPIIEWIRSHDRMGCFERQISEMDNLNLLISDFTNDVEQNTQAIWHTNDVEFPTMITTNEDGTTTEEVVKPKSNDWMQTYTSQDGKTPFVKPLAIDYDYDGMLQNIVNRRALILQKCNVPQRNDNSGGSTGVAMSDATGWSSAEMSASKQQGIMESCKMEEIKVVLEAIRISPFVPAGSPLLKLRYSDIQPNIKRQKTYELTVKTNAICALLSKGFALEDTLTIAPLFEDPNQVVVRSGDGVRKYQESNVFKEEQQQSEDKRPFADYSDQENNSPNIGGMEKEN